MFPEERLFDVDEVYNFQNERIWAPDRTEADAKGGTNEVEKFPNKSCGVTWSALQRSSSALAIFEEETADHEQYIQEVLPVVLKFGHDLFVTTGRFSKMEKDHIFTKKLKTSVGLIYYLSLIEKINLKIALFSVHWIIVFGISLRGLLTGIW